MVSGIRYREAGEAELSIRCKKFDMQTMTWSKIAPLPSMPYGQKLCLLPNGMILAIWADSNERVHAYAYSPADDKWANLLAGFLADRSVYDIVLAD